MNRVSGHSTLISDIQVANWLYQYLIFKTISRNPPARWIELTYTTSTFFVPTPQPKSILHPLELNTVPIHLFTFRLYHFPWYCNATYLHDRDLLITTPRLTQSPFLPPPGQRYFHMPDDLI